MFFSPVQATDLVFLIDGSGSIGSYIFQTEVGRLPLGDRLSIISIVLVAIDYIDKLTPFKVLRFLNEFTELFDIAPDKTRVSVVQYSDQIR